MSKKKSTREELVDRIKRSVERKTDPWDWEQWVTERGDSSGIDLSPTDINKFVNWWSVSDPDTSDTDGGTAVNSDPAGPERKNYRIVDKEVEYLGHKFKIPGSFVWTDEYSADEGSSGTNTVDEKTFVTSVNRLSDMYKDAADLWNSDSSAVTTTNKA